MYTLASSICFRRCDKLVSMVSASSQHLIRKYSSGASSTADNVLVSLDSGTGIFSGGLDFGELYKPKRESFLKFIRSYQQLWMDIYSSPLATVAAINGSSPAGGCVMAIACDYRIMSTQKGTIGLNEVQVGLPIRAWLFEPYVNLLGQRQAELAILRAKLFKPEEALAIGLVDEIVSNEEQLTVNAINAAESFLGVPDHSRRRSKMVCRKSVIENAIIERDQMLHLFTDTIMGEEIQSTLEKYKQSLKKK